MNSNAEDINGYRYEGMDIINLEQTRALIEHGDIDVYILYEDNTEGLIEDISVLDEDWISDVSFGIENDYKDRNYVACFVEDWEEQREIVDYKDKEHLEELKEMYKQKFNDVEILSFKEADAGGVGRPLLEWEQIMFKLEEAKKQYSRGVVEVDLEPELIDDYTFGMMTLRDTESGKESTYTIWADREDPDDAKTIMALGDMDQDELDEVFHESLNVGIEEDVNVSNYIESLHIDDLFSSEQIKQMERMYNYVSEERFFDVDYEDINSTVLIINDVDTNMNVRKFIESEEKMKRFEESYTRKDMKQKEEGIEL